ncbi:hypothetical protein TNCV_1874481 [Trichonephila clavipes]|nr:hypothetical protein TNCV_1874481 [Trichonephila clavipes]
MTYFKITVPNVVGYLKTPLNQRCQKNLRSKVARRGIFDVKDAPRTVRSVVETVDKITEIIEVDRHVSSRSIAQELKIDHKTNFKPFAQLDSKRSSKFGCHTN